MVAGHDHKSPGVTGGDHISPVSDLRFDKVRNQLDKQIVGVGQIWLLGASAAKKVSTDIEQLNSNANIFWF